MQFEASKLVLVLSQVRVLEYFEATRQHTATQLGTG